MGSDGNALATSGVTSQGKPHSHYYGTSVDAFVATEVKSTPLRERISDAV